MIIVYEDMESINIFDDEQCDQSLFDQSDSEILTSHISYNNVTFLQISYFFTYTSQQYGHVLRKDDDDWVKKCMEHEVEGSRARGRPKKTWKEVVREDCQARKLNKEDAMDRCKWRKMIKEAR